MRRKPTESWRLPQHHTPSNIIGKAERIETPKTGLIGRVRPRLRDPLQELEEQGNKQGYRRRSREEVDEPNIQQEVPQNPYKGQGERTKPKPLIPGFWPQDVPSNPPFDTPTIPIIPDPTDSFYDAPYTHEKGGGPRRPKLYPPPERKDEPGNLPQYYGYSSLGVLFQVGKRRRRKRFNFV